MTDVKSCSQYVLTGLEPVVGCYGTGFPSVAAARAYAVELQELGLCIRYSIGGYRDGQYIEVYRSRPVERPENG
jgi:hypothetical protein